MSKNAKKVEVEKVEVENVEIAEVIEIETNRTEGLKMSEFMDSEYGRGLGFEKAIAYWKENGAKKKNVGFRTDFYDKLRIENFEDNEKMEIWAGKNGASANDIKQFTHFIAISDLVRDVRKNLEV